MVDELSAPAAPAPEEPSAPASSGAALAAAPPEAPQAAAEAAAVRQKQRDPAAELGRELKAERQRRERAERALIETQQTVLDLTAKVNALLGEQTQKEAARREAELERLPPEQRIVAEIRQLRQQLDHLERGQRSGGATQETPYQYMLRRSQEIIAEANARHGLAGDLAISAEDLDEAAWSSEQAFQAAALAAARERQRLLRREGEKDMTKKGTTEESEVERRIREGIQRGVDAALRELGVSRPASPRPAGPPAGEATGEEIQAKLTGYNPKRMGPKALVQELRGVRERAAERIR